MHNKIDIGQRCLKFSFAIIQAMRTLPQDSVSRILCRETIPSATSIGANVIEGGGGSTKKEFINFLNIARKSALETNYWLKLMILSYPDFKNKIEVLLDENDQLDKILTTIIKNSKQ